MAKRELRTEDTATDPNEFNVDDQVLIDGPNKISHEDLPATQAQIDDENVETRDGTDFEAGKTARQLLDERREAAENDSDENN